MQSIRVQMHTSSSEDLSRMSVASVSTLTGVSVCACVCVCVDAYSVYGVGKPV